MSGLTVAGLFGTLLELVVLAIVDAAAVWVGLGIAADWVRSDRRVWGARARGQAVATDGGRGRTDTNTNTNTTTNTTND